MRSTIVTATILAAAQAGEAIKANKVCITNSAGFVMDFYFDILQTGEVSHESDTYPID